MLKKILTLLIVLVFGFSIYCCKTKEKTYPDGSKYICEFKDDEPHGQGTCFYYETL